jgi:protein-export membrane protein SecD
MKKKSNIRWKMHASILGIVLVFLLTASTAFPGPWNQAADAIGVPSVKMNEEGFRLGLDLQGGAHLVYEADMSAIPADDRGDALEGIRDVIERRVNAYGVSEPLVQTNISGDNYRVIIELAGVFDISDAIAEIGETPILEFKIPNEDIQIDPTPEQAAQIATAQDKEREVALDLLDRALDGESFVSLVSEFSIDDATKDDGGYVGVIDESHHIFNGLALQIQEENIKTGVIDGLYESASAIHIVNYTNEVINEEVELSHILICHEDSERCDSDRNKVEAQLLAQEIQRDVTTKTFAETATEKSEGPSATSGGVLGWVAQGAMVQAFEDASFALSDGEISDVVETEFGFHIIYRSDTREISSYEISHIEMPWTTLSDIANLDPWMNTELSGKHIKAASVSFDHNTNAPYVLMDFNAEGGELFAQLTEDHIGNVIGIFLDENPISTPVVQQAIYGGQAQITGQFTLEEAKLLALRLNAGALPVPIELLSQQTVGPTLGQVSLERSIQAALVGFVLVALFMILYYRFAGLLAIISLAVYTAINLALYKWLGVTITLAGIAGFILSIGMAVDANVLIFERLKEELHSGRDLRTAIDEGFRRAWTSIRDGNLTTLIAAAVLFSMSTSFIKGFALTLALGIIVSMLTAIFVTRLLLQWVSEWKAFKAKWLYNGPRKKVNK